jgi:diguanylate cyclase (GGDEF)-like protein
MDNYSTLRKTERIRGEKIAWIFRWIVYGMLFLFAAVVWLVQGHIVGLYGLLMSVGALSYNTVLSWFISHRRPDVWIRFVSVTLDVGFITLYNAFDAAAYSALGPMTTATLLIYPIILLLAALRLDRILIVYATLISVLAMNVLYAFFFPAMDPALTASLVSGDIIGQVYRSAYILMCGGLMLFIPNTMDRLLRAQQALREANQENLAKAHTDKLTGLANRRQLEVVMERALPRAEMGQRGCGLLFMDLDGFKAVNDSYGHQAGDSVLREIAGRLASTLRDTDLIARVGGDEFVIVVTQVESVAGLDLLAGRILSAVRMPIMIGDLPIVLGASIGISRYPKDGNTTDVLIRHADKAMYQAKRAGKNRWVFA